MLNDPFQQQSCGERREHERKPFSVRQLIAPIRDGRMPLSEDFFLVRCHDLTPNGFSFLLENTPDFSELIVTFNLPVGNTLIRAEIRNTRKVLFYAESGRMETLRAASDNIGFPYNPCNPFPQEESEMMTLVGCRFTGRRRSTSGLAE